MGGLVLSRRLNESIMIGETIKVEVIEIRGNHVRLHIDAPRDMPVNRKEIADKIAAEQVPE